MAPVASLVAFSLLCLQMHAALSRPSRSIPYFPLYSPWDTGDVGIHAEENKWLPISFSDENSQVSKYLSSFEGADKQFDDSPSIRSDIQPSIPVYEKGKGGFVPPSLSALDKVYWWDKRFNNFDIPPSEDLPFFPDDERDNDYENEVKGSMKKRDYTAAQLVNMLKALAKARRLRPVRIAGKGIRFGISR